MWAELISNTVMLINNRKHKVMRQMKSSSINRKLTTEFTYGKSLFT